MYLAELLQFVHISPTFDFLASEGYVTGSTQLTNFRTFWARNEEFVWIYHKAQGPCPCELVIIIDERMNQYKVFRRHVIHKDEVYPCAWYETEANGCMKILEVKR